MSASNVNVNVSWLGFLALVLLASVGCERPPKELQKTYCEGGIIREQGMGNCLSFGSEPAKNGETVGRVHFAHDHASSNPMDDMFIVKRTKEKNRYQLFHDPSGPMDDKRTEEQKNGLAGTLVQDGFWIEVTMDTQKYHLRSDAPGVMQ